MSAQDPTYYPGKDLFVYVNGVAVGCDTTCTCEMVIKTFDNSNKCTVDNDGNLFGSMIPTITSVKITGDGYTVFDQTNSGGSPEVSGATMTLLSVRKTKVALSFSVGGVTMTCNGYLTSFKQTGKYDEIITYSYQFDSSGVISAVLAS